ncbi:MAG: hypothetical protein A2014_09340 [Spirochaetes bacterium GWF1_49_6]|nr:MAG: hypothetical protein A2014_09340 [Spirochaetes bacterium GWF1_49_6]
MRKILLLPFLLIGISCSSRDFLSNPVLTDQYTAPTIDIYSPSSSTTYNGWVDIYIHSYCPTGVDRIILQAENQSITLYNQYHTSDFSIQTNMSFLTSNWKRLSITAYGVNGLESSKGVDFYVQVPTPSVNISQPWNYETYTNQNTALFYGTADISEGYVSNVFSVTSGDNTNIQITNTASGTNNWSVMVSLFKNMRNTVTIYAVSGKGVISWPQDKQIIVDQQRPVCTLLYPTAGMEVPSTISGIIDAYDALSWINDWSVYYTIDGGAYSTAMKAGMNWEFSLSGNAVGNHPLSVYAVDGVGNTSLTQTISVTVVPDMPLIVMSNWMLSATKGNTPLVYGSASIDAGYNISQIKIKVNNGAWTPINKVNYSGTSFCWSNTNTLINLNKTNTVIAMAISDTSKTNYTLSHQIISDTIPPRIDYVYYTNNQNVVNTDWPYQGLNMIDDLSGLGTVSNIVTSAWFSFAQNSFSSMFNKYINCGLNFYTPGGGTVTNIILAWDMAGNKFAKTNILKVYPNIFVASFGSDSTGMGYRSQPFASVQKGIDFANSIGVSSVNISEGTYNITAPVVLKNGTQLHGGYSADFINQNPLSYPTIIDGGSVVKHILTASGISYSVIDGISLINATGFGLGEKGGGIYMLNSYMEINNSIIENNDSDMGGAVYCQNSTFKMYNSKIDQNTAKKGSAFYFDTGSWAELRNTVWFDNLCDTPVSVNLGHTFYAKDSHIYMDACSNYNNNVSGSGTLSYTFSLLYIDGGESTEIRNSYIQGDHTFNIGVTNQLIGLMFINNPGYVVIENNYFNITKSIPVSKKTIAIWETMPLNGQALNYNAFATNSLDIVYHDTVYGDLLWVYLLNDGMNTGAYYYGGNWGY